MSIDLKQNYFELFGLPVQYSVDSAQLASAFRALQAQHHPDRVASESDEARRIAQQVTSFINTAQETLKSNRLRARYLLSLQSVDFDDERDTTSDMMFLMSQMERREVLEQVPNADDPFDAIDALSKDVKAENKALEQAFETAYAEGDFDEAKQVVLKLKFFERLLGEIKQLEEKLEDEAI
ncbi:Fe-S protein assembly co-chaperone HscB [Leucothrix sargassi]|nr:Fe-S protein assembly co-chaperone HscB [Leucothrix sargassi]